MTDFLQIEKTRYPDHLPDKVLALLRQHVCGLTKKELQHKMGYYNSAALQYCLTALFRAHRVVKRLGAGAQRYAYNPYWMEANTDD